MARSVIKISSKLGRGGKIGLTLFMFFWMAIPSVILVFLGRQALLTAQTFSWKKTDCTIVESQVVEPTAGARSTYAFAVKYRYTWQGRDYVSERLGLSGKASSDYRDAQKWVARFPVDARTVCYVKPAVPGEAVLLREVPWFLFIGLVPLAFIAIGAVVLWSTWRGKSSPNAEAAPASPLSTKPREAPGRGCMALFFSVFLLAGLGFSYLTLIRPMTRMLAAKHWRETPCVILSSRVASHSDSDGTTYSVDILYSYSVAGQELKANRYNFMTGSSSGRRAKEAIVRRYPPNKQTVCYVNPADPSDAVLVREAGSEWWIGLIPLIFVAVGGGGMYFALRKRPVAGALPFLHKTRASESKPGALAPVAAGPVLLRSTRSRFLKLLGGVLIAAFWNGIVSVFLWQVIQSFKRGRPEWFLTVFLIPFVVIGLVLLGFVGYSFLQLFAPGVRLRLSASAMSLGESAELEWEITGRASAIRKLRIWLEGREEATYQRGTKTTTDKSTFASLELASATLWSDIRCGRVRITVPADSMHTFASPHNKIVWTLHVHGDISMYPDVNDEFPLTIRPQSAGTSL